MSQRHNAVPNTHWTSRADENLLTKTCFSGDRKKCTLGQPKKKAVQSEGIHPVALERHYSVPEVATLWGISEKTVRRLFDGEWWRRRESNYSALLIIRKLLILKRAKIAKMA